MLATPDRDRIFTIMRHKNHGMAQLRHMIALLKEAAGLVPDYPAFESVCADSLRQAWHSDRLIGRIAQTGDLHNRRRAWLRLFRHFAPLHGIASDLRIRALDRSGEYVCELDLTRSSTYFAFREHFITRNEDPADASFNEDASFAFDAAGLPQTLVTVNSGDTFNGQQSGFSQAMHILTPGGALYGNGGDDVLYGAPGSRQVVGGPGDNVLYGDGGFDTLFSHEGSAVLDGGPLDDQLYGDLGDDVYIFRKGGGQDTIREYGGTDVIFFGSGFTQRNCGVGRGLRMCHWPKRRMDGRSRRCDRPRMTVGGGLDLMVCIDSCNSGFRTLNICRRGI